jgi:hypothetical protein
VWQGVLLDHARGDRGGCVHGVRRREILGSITRFSGQSIVYYGFSPGHVLCFSATHSTPS